MTQSKSIPNALVGIAGVHYVVAELSLRGLVALPTTRNTAGYDIIVATRDGKEHANIQVKTSQNRVTCWLMPAPNKICVGPNDYYVLLRWLPDEKKFEGFMLTGAQARHEVMADRQRQRQRKRKRISMTSVHVGGKKWVEREKHWKQKWDTWNLGLNGRKRP